MFSDLPICANFIKSECLKCNTPENIYGSGTISSKINLALNLRGFERCLRLHKPSPGNRPLQCRPRPHASLFLGDPTWSTTSRLFACPPVCTHLTYPCGVRSCYRKTACKSFHTCAVPSVAIYARTSEAQKPQRKYTPLDEEKEKR